MKILFADKFPIKEQEKLYKHTLKNSPNLTTEDLVNEICDFDILVVRSTNITAKVIDSATNLKIIIRAGAGTNTIDKDYAKEKGILVCNTPGKNAIAVAELAIGLLISVDRNIPLATADLKKEIWNKKSYSIANGIHGRSVGIIGFGSIGQAFAKYAKALGMNLYVYDRNQKLDNSSIKYELNFNTYSNLYELVSISDIISLHVPFNKNTHNIIDEKFISFMKKGSILINTSRGEIIDESALIYGLDNKKIRAGLDVFCNEPDNNTDKFISKLAKHPSVIGTHHIGASTHQAQIAIAKEVIKVINSFVNGNTINKVN